MKTALKFVAGVIVGIIIATIVRMPIPMKKIVVGLYGCNPGGDMPLAAMTEKTGTFVFPRKVDACALQVQDDWVWTEVVVGNNVKTAH